MTTCTTHHHACNCREQKVAVLIKAALDLAPEVDSIQAFVNLSIEDKERVRSYVERTYEAIEQLGIDVATGKEIAQQPSPETDLDEATRRA